MKNILLLFLVGLALTSCSKDSLDQNTDQLAFPKKSEIQIRVSYMNWSDHCEFSCGSSCNEYVTLITNAKIELYAGDQDEYDALGIPMMNVKTDAEGSALFQDIDPDVYTVWVETSLGKKSRTLTTQLNKRSYLDFSF